MSSINTNRIAVNTILLYVRMVFITLIALLTSRVLLNALGVVNYGIYNVVAGVVVLFSFLNTAMTSATQRFITYSLGTESNEYSNKVFITSVLLHICIAAVFILLSESISYFIFHGLITIPEERIPVAKMVYQFAIIATTFHILAVPYVSTIIAHEKLGDYAVISIIDAILKLSVAYATKFSSFDKLFSYSILFCLAASLTFLLYYIICKKQFSICEFRVIFDYSLFKKMLSFSGWSLLGQFSVVSFDQGSNILLNRFFTVALNTTMGITNQVNNAVNNLVSSFQTAFQPQITKAYANSEFREMNILMQRASRISYFLLLAVIIPIISNIDLILQIWLKIVPEYCGIFCTLILLSTIINSISGPLWMSIFASGDIRRYQIVLSSIYLSQIFIVWLCFKIGLQPYFAIIVKLICSCLILFLRVFYNAKNVSGFKVLEYLKDVFKPILLTTIFILLFELPLRYFFLDCQELVIRIGLEVFCFIISAWIIYIFGFKKSEREAIIKQLTLMIRK